MLSLLFNGSKALDVVQASLELGLLSALDAGPVTVDELSRRHGLVPGRVYKLLDCLESLGFVERTKETEIFGETTYRSVEPLEAAARAVVGPESQERDRDRHPWRTIQGRLPEVLRGEHAIPDDVFPWPPRGIDQVASFEASMAVGCPPIAESFIAARERLWGHHANVRMLDVGGGDGALACALVRADPRLHVDVYNLPITRPLVEQRVTRSELEGRVGFVGGDFRREALPGGYQVLSFVRVLHDWPGDVAVDLLRKAFAALPSGGRLLVSEEFRNSERLAIQFFWSYFLIGLDGCVSRLRDSAFYRTALEKIGFVDIDVVEGPFDIVVATRP
jgi:SAM-dependent methyltransferase